VITHDFEIDFDFDFGDPFIGRERRCQVALLAITLSHRPSWLCLVPL